MSRVRKMCLFCIAALILWGSFHGFAEATPIGAYIQSEANGVMIYNRDGVLLYPGGTFDFVQRNVDQNILVVSGGAFGVLNADGEMIIPVGSRIPPCFDNGTAIVADFGTNSLHSGTKHALIDEYGNNLTGYVWDELDSQNNDLIRACKNGRYGFLNSKGEVVIPPAYSVTSEYSEGIVFVQEEGEMLDQEYHPVFMLNEKGEVMAGPFSVKQAWGMRFSEGLACFCPEGADGKWGYLDKFGQIAIPAQFDFAKDFHGGYAAVRIEDEWLIIDKLGNTVFSPDDSSDCYDVETSEGGYFVVRKKGYQVDLFHITPEGIRHVSDREITLVSDKQGNRHILARVKASDAEASSHVATFLMDEDGNLVNDVEIKSFCLLPETSSQGYGRTSSISDDMLCVSADGKFGYMDLNGEIVVPAVYDKCSDFFNGHAIAFQGDVNAPANEGSFFLFDTAGNAQPLECCDTDLETAFFNLAEKYGCHRGSWFDF